MSLPEELPSNSALGRLQWVSESELGIDWQDGHVSVYSLAHLRKSCPCAVCKEQGGHGLRRGIPLRQRPPVTGELRVIAVQPIGRYAIQLFWSDGHRTGIYSYEYLRMLCPCASCQARRKI